MDRAAILGDGKTLEVAAALGISGSAPSPAPAMSSIARDGVLLTLEQAMRRHIEEALRVTHGRIEGPRGAAELLDINPHTLRARMRKLAIEWSSFRGSKKSRKQVASESGRQDAQARPAL
jgi:transcriptional regulator with GAF, ATPase, and Fis domain